MAFGDGFEVEIEVGPEAEHVDALEVLSCSGLFLEFAEPQAVLKRMWRGFSWKIEYGISSCWSDLLMVVEDLEFACVRKM